MRDEQQLAELLAEFAHTMTADFPLQSSLDRLVRRVGDVLPGTAAAITLVAADGQVREVATSDGTATARATGRSVFDVPLHSAGLRIGNLGLYPDSPDPLSPQDMSAARTLGDVATAYLRSDRASVDLLESARRSDTTVRDPLTGLPNQVLLLDRLEHALLRSRRSGKISAVFLVDLDRSGDVDGGRQGAHQADEVSLAVAARFTDLLRREDTLARLSDDRFVMLCEDLDAPAQAAAIGTRIDAALARPFELSATEVQLTASVGIAFANRSASTAQQVLRDADDALRLAKVNGGGRQQIFDRRHRHPADERADEQAELTRELHEAIDLGQLHTEYQPIVGVGDGRVTGFEALVRWVHPTRGPIPPTTLIPLAEQSGLIAEIGRWVLGRSWTDRNDWQRLPGLDQLAMSVNVSAIELMSADFASRVAAIAGLTGADPRLLTLEIPESVFVSDNARALVVITKLKEIGVKLALDDWTTSYSSLSYLKRFPVDVVKIDRAFVANLGRDPASHIIVGAVVQLAHSLGMTVVAQGVETAEQYDEVTALGCDSCQGYYFARPMVAAEVAGLLRRRRNGLNPRLPERPAALAR